MGVRRISLFLLLFTLAVAAIPVASAAAKPLTLSQLRAQLRHTRHDLSAARQKLAAARTDLADVRALVAAIEALADDGADPAGSTEPAVAGAEPPSPDVTGDAGTTPEATPDPTPSPSPAPLPGLEDPAVAAAIAGLQPALAERLLADGVVGDDELAALEARVVKRRQSVRRLALAARTLKKRVARRIQIRDWNRRGAWRPLIEIAARRYGVNADGLYRMMMYESGGRRYAGSTYKGLFQYHPGTWRASWNPYRSASIYNGWAQIRATAYAISRGMGPRNWPVAYRRAF